jgi:hypothetical protein
MHISPIGHAPAQRPRMYQIERSLLIRPVLLKIVDLEFNIRRDPTWLNGREVISNDFG